MRISKLLLSGLFFAVTLSSLNAVSFVKEKIPNHKEITVYVSENDWGASVNKIVVNIGRKLSVKDFEENKDDFEVQTVLLKRRDREFSDIFLSDGYGYPVADESKYITVLFKCYPFLEDSNPFTKSFIKGVNDVYSYRFVNDELDIKVTKVCAYVNELGSKFDSAQLPISDYTMDYVFYDTPQKKKGTPLIVWFHSIAEGGNSPYLPIFGCKAVNLASNDIQKYFKDGVCILAPQCPTTWLETTSLDPTGNRIWAPVNIQGFIQKYLSPAMNVFSTITNTPKTMTNDSPIVATTSFYTEAAMQVILEYLSDRPYIDRDRIYVGGCSAGGYMTMNMILEYPDFFAAAFPTCEPYPDSKITDPQLRDLRNFPLWFVQAANDGVVKPESNCVATYNRLAQLHATNIHLTLYDNVIDTTGLYFDEEGNPFEYDGHYSWTYLLNNQPEDNGLTIFEWLSKQVKE